MTAEGDVVRVNAKEVDVDGDGDEECGENSNDASVAIDTFGEEGIVSFLQRCNCFSCAFQIIPQADIGPDEVLVVDFDVVRHDAVGLGNDGFHNGALRHQCATEVEDVALDDADLTHHLSFRSIEDAFLYVVNVAHNVIQARKTGFCEDPKYFVEQVGGGVDHVGAALAFRLLECVKKRTELVDVMLVSGDEVGLGEQDVHFAGIGGALVNVEERDVDGEEEAITVFGSASAVGWCDKLFNGKRVHIEMFANVLDIVFCGVFNVNPRKSFVGDNFHGHINFSMYFITVYHFLRKRQS